MKIELEIALFERLLILALYLSQAFAVGRDHIEHGFEAVSFKPVHITLEKGQRLVADRSQARCHDDELRAVRPVKRQLTRGGHLIAGGKAAIGEHQKPVLDLDPDAIGHSRHPPK